MSFHNFYSSMLIFIIHAPIKSGIVSKRRAIIANKPYCLMLKNMYAWLAIPRMRSITPKINKTRLKFPLLILSLNLCPNYY